MTKYDKITPREYEDLVYVKATTNKFMLKKPLSDMDDIEISALKHRIGEAALEAFETEAGMIPAAHICSGNSEIKEHAKQHPVLYFSVEVAH